MVSGTAWTGCAQLLADVAAHWGLEAQEHCGKDTEMFGLVDREEYMATEVGLRSPRL